MTDQEAVLFQRRLTLFHFLRKKILNKNNSLFKKAVEQLKQSSQQLLPTDPAYFGAEYQPELQDLSLILCVAEHGLKLSLQKLNSVPEYGFTKLQLT